MLVAETKQVGHNDALQLLGQKHLGAVDHQPFLSDTKIETH